MASKDLRDQLSKQLTSAKNAVTTVRSSWNDRENLAFTKLANADQNTRKSRIREGSLSTIVLERSARTVAQLPSGKVRPTSKADEGNCRIIEMAIQRYVIPNANDQYPLQTKLFLIDFFSDVYGGLDVLSYWRVDDEYVGPDCQILTPRNCFWQAGKTSSQKAEYVFVSTFVSKDWLLKKKKLKNWNAGAIDRVLKQVKDNGAKPTAREDVDRKSTNDVDKNTTQDFGDTTEFELVTKYERGKNGHWISFLPDYENEIIRDIKNPDPSGKLPVIRKEPILPMLDSIQGQGAIERGESLQKAIDSLLNLTHDGVKYAILRDDDLLAVLPPLQ